MEQDREPDYSEKCVLCKKIIARDTHYRFGHDFICTTCYRELKKN